MAKMIDIHEYEEQFTKTADQVRRSTISERNKSLIFGYRDACLLQQTCGKPRLVRAMSILLILARSLGKDFDQTTREDLERLVSSLLSHQPAYTPETLSTYKAILKRFYTWLESPSTFGSKAPAPPKVSWMTTHVRARDRKKLQRADLLLPSDIENVLAASRNSRNKAFIANLWETGGRISEIGNLQIKHAVPAEHGYTLDVTGKTGQRTPLVISSAPFLAAWLNDHPFKSDPDAPLWVHLAHRDHPVPLRYNRLRDLIIELFNQAGITKRVYPHLFRHSRATYVLASGLMTEAQAKAYFGWTPNSDQLATYAHLLASDANSAILRENNLVEQKKVADELKAVTCYRCHTMNAGTNDYCTNCNAVLNLKKAYEHQQLHDLKEELFTRMFKLMVEKGLIDEAAQSIHDAGLGTTLKRLAMHAKGEQNITVPSRASIVRQDSTPGEVRPAT